MTATETKTTTGVITGLTPTTSPKEEKGEKVKKVKGPKPALISTPRDDINAKKPLVLRFYCPKEQIAKFEIPNPDKKGEKDIIYQLFVPLATWPSRQISEELNVRSHNQNILRGPLVEKIAETIKTNPFDFHLANRGITLLTHHFEYDAKTEFATIKIMNSEESGVADGASTESIINMVSNQLIREYTEQRDLFYNDYLETITHGNKIDFSKIPDRLLKAFVPVRVFVDLNSKSRIYNLVEGQNSSRPVKPISLANFRNEYSWLEGVLEGINSDVRGRVGYEENARKKISVLNIIGLLTLFHPIWEQNNEAPTIAYSGKGRLTNILSDPKMSEGYKALGPIVLDIIKLHDYIHVRFPDAYNEAQAGKSRLARRQSIRAFDNAKPLPMTGQKVQYGLPNGLIFPLLQSFRALVSFDGGKANWITSPFNFFDKHGVRLVSELIQNLVDQNNNPNQMGKKSVAYKSMYNVAKALLIEDKK